MPLKMSTSRCCNRLTRCKCTGSRFWSTRIEACHCEPVLTLAWQSPQVSENLRRSAKAPLADQGWCSAQRIKIEMIAGGNHTIICAAPVRTLGLRGSELSRSDNPSVMALRETAMTAPFTQGSRGAPAPVHYSMVLGRLWGIATSQNTTDHSQYMIP